VPDGTPIAGHASNLFAALDAQYTRDVWQRDILRAVQTWTSVTNIDVAVVPDSGLPLGTRGREQGDSRFGDIRIAGHVMAPDSLSISVPNDPFFAGTWSGDVLINTDVAFGTSESGNADLYSVLLHEVGHVLGLDHSSNPRSVMYAHAATPRTGLSRSDMVDVAKLYGVRVADANEGGNGNDSIGRAVEIKQPSSNGFDFNGSTPLVAWGDITKVGDSDFFKVKKLDNYSGSVSFRVQTQGISLMAPQVRVYDKDGNLLGQATTANFRGDVVTVTLPNASARSEYYVRVNSATNDSFGIGRYGLSVLFNGRLTTSPETLDKLMRGPYENLAADDVDEIFRDPDHVHINDDQGGNDDEGHAAVLTPVRGAVQKNNFEAVGSLSLANDVDVYKVETPRFPGRPPVVLTATASPADFNGVIPRVTVVDSRNQIVPSRILVNGDGRFTVQADGLTPRETYFVRVANPVGGQAVGNYLLNLHFGTVEADLSTLTSSQLTSAASQIDGTLYVARDQLFQYLLTPTAVNAPAGTAVEFTLTDLSGRQVISLTANVGDTVSAPATLLAPGPYRFSFRLIAPTGATGLSVSFALDGTVLGSPIGPGLEDPTLYPEYVYPADPLLYSYPDGYISPVSFYFYYPPEFYG
ncbi:MAG TPA: matrixin family metalloprotease, partial [Pirellulaceae bacterium]|nr:matrixin family metalloprotease [Pirellulaceae bacterium]